MSATAGPFLRYGNCEPGSTTWRGSVLFLTQDGQSSATPAIKDAGEKTEQSDTFINARTNGSGPPPPSPTLSLDDGPAPAKSQGPIKPTLLESVLGWNFWRFDISLELTQVQRSVHYTVTPATGAGAVSATFWLPAAGAPFHWAYTSCNGISGGATCDRKRFHTFLLSNGCKHFVQMILCQRRHLCASCADVPEDHYTRKNPTYLWRDMLQVHSAFPIHALVGGGDQVYSDPVWKESAFLKAWSNLESM